MTVFEKVTQSPEDLASFVTGLIFGTEERILGKLDEYGIQCSIVRPAEELVLAYNLAMLLQEVD